jgi:predicted lipoprotein with Yx(FWY)xxD motif
MAGFYRTLFTAGAIAGAAFVPALGADKGSVPVATPFGITTQPLGLAQGWGLGKDVAASLPRERIAYADLNGMTLYTYDKDPVGKSVCVDDCAKAWPPMPAPASAKASGDWSIVTRADGSKQWAHLGRPLYRFAEDITPGSVAGLNIDYIKNRGPLAGHRGAYYGPKLTPKPVPKDWQLALMFPVAGLDLPAGFDVKEVQDAAGVSLVDAEGYTLYTGDIAQEKKACAAGPCAKVWVPYEAPVIGVSKGDFTLIARTDGIQQWAYKGKPLYKNAGDYAPELADGDGVDAAWQVAFVLRYYKPAGVDIRKTASQGKVLTTAQGMTLYRRDGWLYQSGGGHSFPRGQPARPAVGRDLGTNPHCGEQFDSMKSYECTKAWQPFLAPNDAQPSGFWDVATRADGRKQWVYQGYALWTFAGDKKPGDITGHDQYDIAVSDDPNVLVNVGTQMDGSAALFWTIAVP